MQKSAGVWMDEQRAYVIENCNGKETLAIIHALMRPDSAKEQKHYFKNVAKELGGANDVFLCGPGNMKNDFAHYLVQQPSAAPIHVELDPMLSHPTLNILRAKAVQRSSNTMLAC